MEPLQRFDSWVKSPTVDKYGMTFAKVRAVALESGYTFRDLEIARQQIRVWLVANEGTKKTQKSKWGRFFLNWLRKEPYQPGQRGRLAPSNFD